MSRGAPGRIRQALVPGFAFSLTTQAVGAAAAGAPAAIVIPSATSANAVGTCSRRGRRMCPPFHAPRRRTRVERRTSGGGPLLHPPGRAVLGQQVQERV